MNKPYNNGLWDWDADLFHPDICGFTYLIIAPNGRWYIGRKVTRTKHGKMAGYRNYKSSCKPLLVDIGKLGIENFKFIVLGVWEHRNYLWYQEVKEMMASDALIDPNSYNNNAPSIYVPPKNTKGRRRDESVIDLLRKHT